MDVIGFCLFVGIGSTIALDIWVLLVEKLTGIPPTNWGMVGRWIAGMPLGHLVLRQSDRPISGGEKVIGWLFHYGVGIAYAGLILLLFGTGFVENPEWFPVIIVGLVLSTLAGLAILMPGLGGGFFGRLMPDKLITYGYLVIAHGVFAIAQYYLSELYLILF